MRLRLPSPDCIYFMKGHAAFDLLFQRRCLITALFLFLSFYRLLTKTLLLLNQMFLQTQSKQIILSNLFLIFQTRVEYYIIGQLFFPLSNPCNPGHDKKCCIFMVWLSNCRVFVHSIIFIFIIVFYKHKYLQVIL